MTDEEYVRARWERAESCPRGYSDADPTWAISCGGRTFTRACVPDPNARTEAEAWSAARAFTEQREREIAEVEEEIRLLEFMFRFACVVPAEHEVYGRIISREQAALAELRRGWVEKEGS